MTTNASGMATTCRAYRCHGKKVGLSGVKAAEGGERRAGSVAVSLLFVIRFLRVYKLASASGCHGIPFNY